jgi:hypothetical protein
MDYKSTIGNCVRYKFDYNEFGAKNDKHMITMKWGKNLCLLQWVCEFLWLRLISSCCCQRFFVVITSSSVGVILGCWATASDLGKELSWHIHRLIVHQHNVVFLHVALQQGVHVEVQLKNEIGKNELELEEKRKES